MDSAKGATPLLTRRSIPLAVLAIALHIFLLVNALTNQTYLTDDSIQYLTLSENLLEEGVFSQSYLPPLVPDLQRTPGYPALLAVFGNSLPAILVWQHAMVFLSGLVLFQIMKRLFGLQVGRWGAWIWLLQPYPILMASMVLSEVPFILAFLLGIWGMLAHLRKEKGYPLVWGLIAMVVAVYIRPVALPVLLLIMVVVLIRALKERGWLDLAIGALLVPLLLSPWVIRNHGISGKWMLTSMGDMAMLHGRLGGLEAYRQGKGVGETGLFRLGDSLAIQEKGLQGYRAYYSDKQSHETELYRGGATGTTITYYLSHPLDGIAFQAKSFFAMLKGVGFGWSHQVTGSRTAAYIMSGIQACLNLVMFLGCLWALWRMRKWPKHLWLLVASAGLLLLISNAAWADGRYRMVVDPLLVVMTGVMIRDAILKFFPHNLRS